MGAIASLPASEPSDAITVAWRKVAGRLEGRRARSKSYRLIWKLSYTRADLETVEVSNYRAGTSKLSQYRSLEQTYTVLTHGMLEQTWETVEVSNYRAGTSKLSQYRSLEQSYTVLTHGMLRGRSRNCRGIELSSRDFKTVAISVTRGLKMVLHIEQGLENCRGIAPSISSRDLKTVEVAIEQGLVSSQTVEHYYMIWLATWAVRAWPKNRADRETVEVSNYRAGTSKLSQYRSLEQSYTVLTHGLHVRALALRHTPLQAT